jgi:hypothetical protein
MTPLEIYRRRYKRYSFSLFFTVRKKQMNSEYYNSPPSSHNSRKSQPIDSLVNPYESSQGSLDSNERSTIINNNNNSSFGSVCLDCLQCCSASMEILFCCCIFTECLR